MIAYDIDDDIPLRRRTLAQVWSDRVARSPGQPFLWFPDGGRRPVDALDAGVRRAAAGFLSRSVGKQDRVCVFMRNSPEMLCILLALWRIGAVVVPLSPQQQGALLVDQVERADPVLIVADAELQAQLGVFGPKLRTAAEFCRREDVCSGAAGAPDPAEFEGDGPQYHEPAMIMYTSGSTGPSKGCVLSHHMCVYYGWCFWRYMDYRDSDTIHTCLPLNHNHALFASFFPAVMAGARFALSQGFSARRYWGEVAESEATTCSAIGPMASILLNQPVAEVEERLRVRIAHIAPSPPRVEEFQKRFRLQVVSCLYGSSEAMVFPPDRTSPPVLNLIGPAPRDWDVAIVDEKGLPCPVGVVGELLVRPRRPKILFEGYFNMPEATRHAWRDLWHHTGDRCRLDEQGRYWFCGRAKEVIRRRGENVSIWELESVIGRHPDISEIAAIPLPAGSGDEEIALVIKTAAPSEAVRESVREFCESELPRFMRPDHILLQIEELAKTQSGKIDRIAVRQGVLKTFGAAS